MTITESRATTNTGTPSVLTDTMRSHANYLGKHIDEVLDELEHAHSTPSDQDIEAAVARLNSNGATAAAVSSSATWYTGSATLGGFIRGTLDASIYFGSHGNFRFSGSMWSGPAAVTGGGGGAWSMIPADGQQMDFVYWGASSPAGAVNILWNVNKVVVGSMAIAVAGVTIGGGSGIGTWKQGN